MTWTWHVHTTTEHVRGESTSILGAARWVQALLECSTGIAEAAITSPAWPVVRMSAVDGVIRAEGDDGDDD